MEYLDFFHESDVNSLLLVDNLRAEIERDAFGLGVHYGVGGKDSFCSIGLDIGDSCVVDSRNLRIKVFDVVDSEFSEILVHAGGRNVLGGNSRSRDHSELDLDDFIGVLSDNLGGDCVSSHRAVLS